jgi:hypothetical protein
MWQLWGLEFQAKCGNTYDNCDTCSSEVLLPNAPYCKHVRAQIKVTMTLKQYKEFKRMTLRAQPENWKRCGRRAIASRWRSADT